MARASKVRPVRSDAAVPAVRGAPLRAGLVAAAGRDRGLPLEDRLQRARRLGPGEPQDLDAAHEGAGRRRDQHALGLGALAADLQPPPPVTKQLGALPS